MLIDEVAQLTELDFERAGGLLPVIAQHARSGEVLMLAYASEASLVRTLTERVMWYHSRSRGRLWKKGETSGNVQRVVTLHADCDRDALVARVLPVGPSCHTGDWSCFSAPPTLAALDAVIAARAAESRTHEAGQPASYTQKLLGDENLRLKKLGEEAIELALACARMDADQVAAEAADLLYHTLVACRGAGVSTDDVIAALEARRGLSAAGVARERRDTGSAG